LCHLREKPLPDNPPTRIIVHRNGPGAKDFLRNGIVRKQIISLTRAGPAVIKDLIGRNHEYVGINKRAPTKARPDDRIHVLIVSNVENSVCLFSAVDEPADVTGSTHRLLRECPEV